MLEPSGLRASGVSTFVTCSRQPRPHHSSLTTIVLSSPAHWTTTFNSTTRPSPAWPPANPPTPTSTSPVLRPAPLHANLAHKALFIASWAAGRRAAVRHQELTGSTAWPPWGRRSLTCCLSQSRRTDWTDSGSRRGNSSTRSWSKETGRPSCCSARCGRGSWKGLYKMAGSQRPPRANGRPRGSLRSAPMFDGRTTTWPISGREGLASSHPPPRSYRGGPLRRRSSGYHP